MNDEGAEAGQDSTALADGTALCRIRGEDALLLYIGTSEDFGRRWKEHAKRQPWWAEMRSMSVDRWYGTRDGAEEAETAAIKAERPKYNKRHNNGHAGSPSLPSRPDPRDGLAHLGADAGDSS